MPKKFKEVNSKAAEARERKATIKKDADERKKSKEEDEYWKDDDKHGKKKQDRKEERDRKKQEQLERKLELKKLTIEEEASLKTYKAPVNSGGPSKVTRAEIAEKKSLTKTSTGATASVLKTLPDDPPLLENPNLILKERAEQGHHDASTIDEAIVMLSTHEPSLEKHPEKRMKAAYAAFEEHELPILKEEFPNLRLSQLKQRLRKDWMKSPENPINQAHTLFNS